jgi:hypothetical protein
VFSTLHARLRAHWAPGIPAPSEFREREISKQTSRKTCGEIAESHLDVIARSEATSNPFFVPDSGLLRFARNDGLEQRATLSIVVARLDRAIQ